MPAARAQKAPWVRTCVGCRKRAPASELLRVVAEMDPAGGRFWLVPDPTRSRPGRGAHLHPDPACLALAQRRRAFGRALRLSSVPDAGAVVEWLESARAPRPDSGEKDRTIDMSTR
ncbi:YlxR family protein [Natronosporangium hydrolyticum]|uniref:YlxR family protein n=1 Tax=Natronosporangium hydrolyticum TaxID=2811111 RepID=A0A895YB19_9ACTN|nr:YlxR family protein [Natronosporangium hydrolyticum]QSB13485.1 YlxR family protein [Natronosporangium hydrolyticum]